MFYLLINVYEPNQAYTNRLLSYLTALDEKEIKTTIVFLLPNNNGDRLVKSYKNITIVHYWKNVVSTSSIFRLIRFQFNLRRFIRSLNRNDIVYTYGINRATKLLVNNSKIKTFAEITEHPIIVDGGRTTAISEQEKYRVARKLNKLFVISTALKDLFKNNGVKECNIEIINMIVDISRFSDLKKKDTNQKYIAYCGSAYNNKDGVDRLIKAFSSVAKEIEDINLWIIGSVPKKEEFFDNLELIKQLNLVNRITFTGPIDAKYIPQVLKNAEILALARPNNQQALFGFPTKLGEYLLTKNPVVITNVGDIPLYLEDCYSAIIAQPDDIEDFAVKLRWAINNKTKANLIGKKGFEIAQQYFNPHIEINKIINAIYNC